ncbi:MULTISPECIES: hypothetical protein [Fusobacterium]|jgi:hypothetical protein|uniref:hypothetical protein n=1 Tax=Fusobacterium TaxID=848 RepID=UPI0004505954|nr:MULTISPECIES: hypothetical protein [Fusobacterium]EUB36309.1 hypothetical protein HMPREF1501_1325 [Fusobacterium sp. OBRC1]WRL72403.1 hypothetical protein VKN77_08700 [Fusobacterium polymorphum]
MSNKNIKEEKRMIPVMISNIKDKGLLEDILNDNELKKEALLMLGKNEKSVEEILKDENMKKEIKNILSAELINQIETINEKLIEENTSLKKSIKELEKEERALKKEVDEKKNLQQKLKEIEIEIEKLEKDKQELELSTENLENLRTKIKEKNGEKHLLLEEITNKEIEKKVLEENIKNLEKIKESSEYNFSNISEKTREEQENLQREIITSYNDETERQKKKLNQEINELKEVKSSKEELIDKENKLNIKEKNLIELEKDIKSKIENFEKFEKEIREKEKEKNSFEISDLEKELEELRNEYLAAKNEIRRLENLNADSFIKEELNSQIEDLKKSKKELEEKLLGKGNLQTKEIDSLKDKIKTLKEKNTEVIQENTELYKERMDFIKYRDKIEVAERALPELERSKESLIALLEKKQEEINELKSRQMSEVAKRETIEQAYFLIEEKENDEMDEIKWLNKIKESFNEVGFKFSDRLLYAFHTSLKIGDWNPLTVLAGVSGTGKSELPRLYSRYGGINFLPLAVQSNWDSPYSLFGYYNSLEGKFNATSLLKVLYQAQEDAKNSISEYLTIVLLDEMNLAHVELYFSELLSKLELLRGSEEVKLEIDIAEKNPYEIKLNKNIIWVGTMNEDETTKSLSDKVIDRSNLINFPRPNEFVSRNELKESDEAPKLKREIWENWKWNKVKDELIKDENNVNNKEKIKKLEKRIDELKRKMEEINEYLKVSGKAIGHRVWQSIENYIRNYPLVLSSIKNQDDEEIEKAIQSAFEDALVQKLMPKLRGLDINGEIREECLNKIREKISTYANGIVSDFDNALKNPYGVFVWNSSEYLLDKNDK